MGLKLMCVVAHPDDECFAFGGGLALAAERGIETYVVCLTDGKAATHRGEATSGEELGRTRAAEFASSCAVLGVHHHEMLDLEDGRIEFADFSRTAGRLVERMRRFRPDVVVTFGLDGSLNTHPDHMMVAMLTDPAFNWAGRSRRYPELAQPFQPSRLFFLSTSVFLPERQAPLPAPWSVRLDIRSVLGKKMEAFRAHRSQAPLMESTREFFAEHGNEEFYTLGGCPSPEPVRLEDDLFAGL